MPTGLGFDIHRLVEGRKLLLGGVQMEFPLGLLGHSDADALLHAICDALLGAAGLGDIGEHFPDTDPQFKDVSSALLLERVLKLVTDRGYAIENVDTIVYAEQPKLTPHKPAIRQKLAELLKLPPERVNVKAKTMEKLGPIGGSLAIAAHAIVSLGPGRR
jgi:2-C-methyl-D-erythritol 2,4-cyclodiphosphate synthase